DSDYGAGFAEAFEKAAADTGLDLNIIVYPTEAQDLTAELAKVKDFDPDVLIIDAVYAAKNLAIKQARVTGLDVQIIAGWDWPTLSDVWPTVGEAGEGIIYASFTGRGEQGLTDIRKKFKESYIEEYDHSPTIFQYFFIDTLNALKHAVEETDSTDAEDLVDALPSLEFPGTTGDIVFTRDEGTVRYNQWDSVKMYFKKLHEIDDTGDDAEVVYSVQ